MVVSMENERDPIQEQIDQEAEGPSGVLVLLGLILLLWFCIGLSWYLLGA